MQMGKTLLRKAKDGRVLNWNVEDDDSLCTLQEAFQKVDSHLGFNIELKFDDDIIYKEEELTHALEVILQACSFIPQHNLTFRVRKTCNQKSIYLNSCFWLFRWFHIMPMQDQ